MERTHGAKDQVLDGCDAVSNPLVGSARASDWNPPMGVWTITTFKKEIRVRLFFLYYYKKFDIFIFFHIT